MLGKMGNMGNMMKKVQKMQADMARMQEGLKEKTVEATAGGGAIRVVVSGAKELKELKINPEVVDAEDVEMLEDLILACINEALRKADEMVTQEMGKITGGINIPGLF